MLSLDLPRYGNFSGRPVFLIEWVCSPTSHTYVVGEHGSLNFKNQDSHGLVTVCLGYSKDDPRWTLKCLKNLWVWGKASQVRMFLRVALFEGHFRCITLALEADVWTSRHPGL